MRLEVDLITIAVPVLGRPRSIEVVLKRFDGLDVLFLPDESDEATIAEIERHGASYSIAHEAEAFGVPTYATKLNRAYHVTSQPFIMYASDDIVPQPGWLEHATSALQDESIGLLGLKDGLRPDKNHLWNATHGIIRRSYIEAHGSASLEDAGPVFWEGYRHACVDVEVTGVAIKRGAYRYEPRAALKHDRRVDATTSIGVQFLEDDRARMRARQLRWAR